jgi:hypothetical protein
MFMDQIQPTLMGGKLSAGQVQSKEWVRNPIISAWDPYSILLCLLSEAGSKLCNFAANDEPVVIANMIAYIMMVIHNLQ